MRLETVSKIKAGVALVCLGLPILIYNWPQGGADFAGLALPLGTMFWVGIFVGISWVRQRRRMRTLDYAARQFRKG